MPFQSRAEVVYEDDVVSITLQFNTTARTSFTGLHDETYDFGLTGEGDEVIVRMSWGEDDHVLSADLLVKAHRLFGDEAASRLALAVLRKKSQGSFEIVLTDDLLALHHRKWDEFRLMPSRRPTVETPEGTNFT